MHLFLNGERLFRSLYFVLNYKIKNFLMTIPAIFVTSAVFNPQSEIGFLKKP